jgi:hypothetical protein
VLALVALLATVWAAGGVPGARAGGPVEIIADEHGYVFSDALDFYLSARSEAAVIEVILFYGREGTPLVRRIYPEIEPGTGIEVSHTEELESGQFAPGTVLRYWWRLLLADGRQIDAEPRAFEYTDTNQDWRTTEGTYVDLYWYGRDAAHAQDILAAADEAVERLGDEMGVPIERRVRVYVYNSQGDMRPALSTRSESYDDRVLTLGVAVDEYTLLLLGTHRDVFKTAAHELSHIVVGIATDNPYTDLPRWLDEGLAMYAEGELPDDNRYALEDAIEADRLLTIRSMTSYSGRASDVDLFYGQAYSIVSFMLDEFGRAELHDLLAALSEGMRQEDVLMRVYGFGLDELDDRWRTSLGLQPRPRSGALRVPSPVRGHVPAGV